MDNNMDTAAGKTGNSTHKEKVGTAKIIAPSVAYPGSMYKTLKM